MVKSLPTAATTTNQSFESANADIASLFTQYISPIEELRSIARPAVSSGNTTIADDFKTLQIDSRTKLESRCHAFYRMIGFPVLTSDGSFYNPGFDPSGGKAINAHYGTDTKFASNTSLQVLINVRETNPQEVLQIFANQDLTASLYALVLRYVKPFNVIAPGKQPLDLDPQFFTVDDRTKEIQFFSSSNPNLADSVSSSVTVAGQSITGGRHILKPFVVDPRLERVTSPDTSKICVPFLLDKTATKINEREFLKRPAIEFILRQRLAGLVADTEFLSDVQKLINGDKGSSLNVDISDLDALRSTVAALANDNNISSSVKDILSGFTDIQITTVTSLVKSIKAVVKRLADDIHTIDLVKSKINWVPIPSTSGPETGAKGAQLSRLGTSGVTFELDSRITELRILKLNADRTVSAQADLGEFAVPFKANVNTEDVSAYQEQIEALIRKRDSIAADGFTAMGEIEVITGEVSGLGLVDVLATYAALFSIKLGSLLAFLDNDAFSRLTTNNPDLAAIANQNRGTSILTAMGEYETIFTNILSFADKQLQIQLQTPTQTVGMEI